MAGKSPNIRSYTVYIYGSGQPYSYAVDLMASVCTMDAGTAHTMHVSLLLELARTIYNNDVQYFLYNVRYNDILGREMTKYTVMNCVYLQFWPALYFTVYGMASKPNMPYVQCYTRLWPSLLITMNEL